VDQADLGKAVRMSLVKVVIDNGADVGRREGVQVQRILDRDADRLAVHAGGLWGPHVTGGGPP